ncbi:tyrosine-type recombinase/integrase [Pilibacter termitis]|uniref:tyrosine-type recombinase/integrase n=1 Tax=Pilibacter termitis TaxID=263852 RepID=UPI00135629BC|nr:site-specific integrase [Pilibacter termitis]
MNEKIDRKIQKQTQSDITLAELFEKWQALHFPSVKSRTKLTYSQTIYYANELLDTSSLVRNIDTSFIQSFFENEKIMKQSNGYKKNHKMVLNMIFSFAEDMGYLQINPVKKVKVPKKEKTIDQINNIRNKYLTMEELSELLKAMQSENNNYCLIAEFLARTGLRYGECIALCEENIKGDKIEIVGSVDSINGIAKPKITSPKNLNSYRVIEIDRRTKEILNMQIERNTIFSVNERYCNDEKRIFCTRYGGIVSNKEFNKFLKSAKEKTTIKKELTSHIFRHTHISLLAELNVPIKAISERVGHGNQSTTLEIYNHVTENMKSNIVNKLDKISLL